MSLPSTALTRPAEQNTQLSVTPDLPVLPSTLTEPTASQEWGPYYVRNAPFRAKICPAGSPGIPLIITGRVFGLDTHGPLPFATIDVWHARPDGTYDYYEADPNAERRNVKVLNTHGMSEHFDNRARLIADEQGQYEFETVQPPPYYVPYSSRWRCPHIHYYVQASGYKPVLTQLYFKGGERNETDIQIQESITIELKAIEREQSDGSKLSYNKGQFDIIMAPSTSDC